MKKPILAVGAFIAVIFGVVASTVAVDRTVTSDPQEPTVLANAIDRQRMADLDSVAMSLHSYLRVYQAYPDTLTQVQSLCVYPEDMGCVLFGTVAAVPRDPSGADYWYQSDGQRYILYAERDGDEAPLCQEPEHLASLGIDDVLCVIGP